MKAISLRLEPAQYERLRVLSLFCQDMSHPSLAIERIEGYPGVWSGRVSQKYR